MKIIIYSTVVCPFCKQLKDYLESKGVAFEEKLIDQDEGAKEEMVKHSGGFLGVPFVTIERDGKIESVLGFDKKKIDSILG
jgi:glutaredoxin